MSRKLGNRLRHLERSRSQQQWLYEAQYRSAEQLCEECDDLRLVARYETAVERLRIVEAEAEKENQTQILATGLRSEFEKLGIPLQALYVHGSYNRATLVAEGKADFAILSREAASHAAARKGEWSTLDLGPWTYYSVDSLVVLLRPGIADMDGSAPADEGQKAREIRVVGIDPDSYDHHQLTLAEFPDGTGLEYVHCAYPHIPAAVAEGMIDAAVWNRTMLAIPLELVGVAVRPLRHTDSIALSRSLNRAVLLSCGVRLEVAAILGRIDRRSVTKVQGQVLTQEILPMY